MANKGRSMAKESRARAARKTPIRKTPVHTTRSLTVREGVEPGIQTVIYVHGIGNKPPEPVLKCQWDRALFEVSLGDRSRMAYWVNREFYPSPLAATCAGADVVAVDDDEMSTKSVRAIAGKEDIGPQAVINDEIEAVSANKREQECLRRIAQRMLQSSRAEHGAKSAADFRAKVLPTKLLRSVITPALTRAFLRDVHDFLFVPERREVMETSFRDRLASGGGPFLVIAHSQGSMVAYSVLRKLAKNECAVPLFITIGSPLGLEEVKDELEKLGALKKPDCVTRWVNVAERLDPVAADNDISNDYAGDIDNEAGLFLNPDSWRHPHSGTGYLKTKPVREAVREIAGNAFGQAVGQSVIAKDLVEEIESGLDGERYHTLIQLSRPDKRGEAGDLRKTSENIRREIEKMVTAAKEKVANAEIDELKRYIAARLTRGEIERLRSRFSDLAIERVWKDAAKRALIYKSTHTVQAHTANIGYAATGSGVCWAVLDTGIRGDHPHFGEFENIERQWDCTGRGPAVELAGADRLDRNGHGTHVAGAIAGSFKTRVKPGDTIEEEFKGMAPRTKIYGFKVLDDRGNGHDSYIIKALDTIAELNEKAGKLVVQGANLSLGGNFDPSVYGCGHTPLCQELRRLWGQGVLVVLAAGNEGYALLQAAEGELPSNMDLTIGDPANLEEAIAVGSIHKSNPHTYGVSFFSSRGPTADGRRKPDLVAPGEHILSAYHDYKVKKAATAQDLYIEMSGTSMAAPHVSGVLAAFLSIRREFIGYPNRVKELLLKNCTDLNRDPYIQGAGMPNLIKMLVNS